MFSHLHSLIKTHCYFYTNKHTSVNRITSTHFSHLKMPLPNSLLIFTLTYLSLRPIPLISIATYRPFITKCYGKKRRPPNDTYHNPKPAMSHPPPILLCTVHFSIVHTLSPSAFLSFPALLPCITLPAKPLKLSNFQHPCVLRHTHTICLVFIVATYPQANQTAATFVLPILLPVAPIVVLCYLRHIASLITLSFLFFLPTLPS